MKKWRILAESGIGNHELEVKGLVKILLENRGIKSKKEIEEFLNPKLENVTVDSVGINKSQLQKAIKRIKKAIVSKEKIVIFGDYDVDGICGTAILWETLNKLGADVMPYIPHRIEEGYGLSIKGIQNLLSVKVPPLQRGNLDKPRLIVTVDNGIVANNAVEFANSNEIDVIITDHHTFSKTKPNALAIVHTTKLCGASAAYMLAQEILNPKSQIPNKSLNTKSKIQNTHLELAALATVADLVPLQGANRTLLKFGLEKLKRTERVGLLELFKEAVLNKDSIGVYEIGHIIAPRLNAMGRLEYAMDSLRLLCTNNKKKAEDLARLLGNTNRERQELTLQTILHAKDGLRVNGSTHKKLIFISHETYEQGIIGLVAGKIVDEYYRPSVVVSIGEKLSKGSARSVSGFNIIEFIRESSSYLIDAGGHPMAAGFTVETTKLLELKKDLEDRAESIIDEEVLIRSLKIDLELPLSFVSQDLYDRIQAFSPFGMGNPEPVFLSKELEVDEMNRVGYDKKHLKLRLRSKNIAFDCIGFGLGEKAKEIKIGDKIDIVYTIDKNEWNGEKKLQLKIKDFRQSKD